jgi:hypothetical protein
VGNREVFCIAPLILVFRYIVKNFFLIIGDCVLWVYIKAMNLLKPFICILLMLSLVGCAVSRNPNPVIRYGANTGATLAGPGFAVMCVAASIDEDEESKDDVGRMALFGMGAAAAGFVVGAVLGGTVGFFKWMFNGFENDNVPKVESLPENVKLPVRNDTYGEKL